MTFTALASGGSLVRDWHALLGDTVLKALGFTSAKNYRIPLNCVAGIVRPVGESLLLKGWNKSSSSTYYNKDRLFGEDLFHSEDVPLVSPLIGGVNPELGATDPQQRRLWADPSGPSTSDYSYYADRNMVTVYKQFVVSSLPGQIVMSRGDLLLICHCAVLQATAFKDIRQDPHALLYGEEHIRVPSFPCIVHDSSLVDSNYVDLNRSSAMVSKPATLPKFGADHKQFAAA